MDEKILVYGLVVVAIVLLAWTVAGALKPAPVAAAAGGAIGTDDACRMPDGYAGGLQAWREHLGHHAETREKCLAA